MGRLDDYRKLQETGIYRHETTESKYRVIATAKSPETGATEQRQATLTGATKREAIEKREAMKAKIRGDAETSQKRRYVADFAASWTNTMKGEGQWSERTYKAHCQILEDHILPVVGDVPVDALQRDDIRRWIDVIEAKTHGDDDRGYAHASLRRFWATMKHLVRALYLEGHTDRRLVEWTKEVRGPTSDVSGRRETRTLTLEELRAFLAAAREDERWGPHMVTLAYTAMRFGESAGLEWRDVDFGARTIRVRRSCTRGRIGDTKTGETRTIGMAEPVQEMLRQHRDRMMRAQHPGLEKGIVFPDEDGTRLKAWQIHPPMEDATERANADIDVTVGPQVLRKTLPTLLDNAGAQRKMVKAIAGHETDEMSDHYDEKRPEDQIEALRSVVEGGGG